MGVIGGGSQSKNKTMAAGGGRVVLTAPTRQIIDEMLGDVAMMDHSKWDLNDNVLMELNKDKNGEIVLHITDRSGSMLVDEILDVTRPFFAGRHHNPLTNNHDGTFDINLTDRYAEEDRLKREAESQKVAAAAAATPVNPHEMKVSDYRVHSYMVQEMISDTVQGSFTPWKVDDQMTVQLQKAEDGGFHLNISPIGDRHLNAKVVEDIAHRFGRGTIVELNPDNATVHFKKFHG